MLRRHRARAHVGGIDVRLGAPDGFVKGAVRGEEPRRIAPCPEVASAGGGPGRNQLRRRARLRQRAQRVLGLLRIFFKGCDRTRHAPTLQYVTPHSGPWVGQTGARRETNRNGRPDREES